MRVVAYRDTELTTNVTAIHHFQLQRIEQLHRFRAVNKLFKYELRP